MSAEIIYEEVRPGIMLPRAERRRETAAMRKAQKERSDRLAMIAAIVISGILFMAYILATIVAFGGGKILPFAG